MDNSGTTLTPSARLIYGRDELDRDREEKQPRQFLLPLVLRKILFSCDFSAPLR